MVDGGQDENPRFYGQIMACALLFMRRMLQLLVVFTRAGGFSSLNAVERAQCWVTCALSGCKFPSDHYGKVRLDKEGLPRTAADEELEKSNHEYACAQVVKCINAGYAYDKEMSACIPPTPGDCDEHLAIDDEGLEAHRAEQGACTCQVRANGTRCAVSASGGTSCKKCAGNDPPLPCSFRCKCSGNCDNPTPLPAPSKLSEEELATLPLEDMVLKLTPQDVEFWAVKHGCLLWYSLQFKLCKEEDRASCWYCSRYTRPVVGNLDFYPVHTVSDGEGGWRRSMK